MTLISEMLGTESVRQALADHFRDRVAEATEAYADSSADEDSLTGALGQALRGRGSVRLRDGRVVRWMTRYRKLRGRGPNAPEKKVGADGLFEVELEDDQRVRSRKSLPFQAKNNASSYGDSKLWQQAGQLTEFPGGGIVVNYRPEGYVALDAAMVANGEATREVESPLAESLGRDFLECRRGSTAYLFEPSLGGIFLLDGPLLVLRRWSPEHRIRTTLVLASKPDARV
jgi:hypothetical protein